MLMFKVFDPIKVDSAITKSSIFPDLNSLLS
jgi:hypothetical protein